MVFICGLDFTLGRVRLEMTSTLGRNPSVHPKVSHNHSSEKSSTYVPEGEPKQNEQETVSIGAENLTRHAPSIREHSSLE